MMELVLPSMVCKVGTCLGARMVPLSALLKNKQGLLEDKQEGQEGPVMLTLSTRQVWSQLAFWFRKSSKQIFKMVAVVAIVDF